MSAQLRNTNQALLGLLDTALDTQDVDQFRKETLHELYRLLSLDSATFFLVKNDRFVRPYDINIDSTLRREYMEYYYRISVFRPDRVGIRDSDRCVFRLDDLVCRPRWEKSEFYCDHFKYLGISDIVGVYLRHEGRLLGCICLNRANQHRAFQQVELRFAGGVGGLLAKALHLHLLREQEEQELGVLQAASELHDCGILVLNKKLEILFCNTSGRELAAQLEGGREAASSVTSLVEHIRRSLAKNGGSETCHFARALPEKEICSILVKVLPGGPENSREPLYLVEMRRLGPPRHLEGDALRQRYDLSPREVEVVGLIAQGLCNKEIADRLRISPWTVITHVKNIFEKMHVHNRTSAVQRALQL